MARTRKRAGAGLPAPRDPDRLSPLAGKRILYGVTGSIAAYRAGDVVRELGRRGASVVVVMTASAKHLVTAETFRGLTGREVYSELFPDPPERTLGDPFGPVGIPIHIRLASEADLIVVAPATANVLAKMAVGLADDLLSTLLLVARSPVVVAPAMNPYMLHHPTVAANLATLVSRGVVFVEPEVGLLACGYEGEGKLASLEAIVERVESVASRMPPGPGTPLGAPGAEGARGAPARAATRRVGPAHARGAAAGADPALPAGPLSDGSALRGKSVLVTAGRTEEAIDPVRYLSNRSSGRMGFEIARAARDRGAHVTVVAGRTDVEPPLGVSVVRATTAAEMARATRDRALEADVVVMCAAVADWTPADPSPTKLKKAATRNGKGRGAGRAGRPAEPAGTPGGGEVILRLAPTEDILAALGRGRRAGQLLVGFALESDRAVEEGRRKLRDKNLDLIVVNDAGKPGVGPGAERNAVTLIDRSGRPEPHPVLPKSDAAERILDKIERLLRARKP